jgi:hypothetical protein
LFSRLGQHLVKHVISRCAVANSSDDIVITALDAVHWTSSAWAAVTQSTINNTFQTAGFKSSLNQETAKALVDSENETEEETNADDASSALQTLDMLLSHVSIGGQSLSASEFVEVDDETPAFNEWNDPGEPLIVVDEVFGNHRNEEEEDECLMNETPPKLIDALEMVRRLHLLAATEQPQLHSLISQLDSQLTQLFIDSKVLKQTTIDDFFVKK